jgi:5-methylcytosine-specific restriction endonuclease McrA
MTKQTKAKQIPVSVKKKVWDRDGGECIICGNPNADPSCHYIRRSQGGLGIEQNIVTLCARHHLELDSPNSPEQKLLRARVREHLEKHYPGFPDEKRIYRK